MKLKIIFMGTPEFALTSLKALHEEGHDIIAVYCQPPKEKGRGYKIQKNPTHIWAEMNDIPVYTPKSLRHQDEIDRFKNLKADVAVVAAYGMILPKEILEIPVFGCVNIHGSLLPRWRGAAPIQRALMEGDEKTGITTMFMDEGLDTGDMLEWEELSIHDHTTLEDLYIDLADLGARLIKSTLYRLYHRQLSPTPQPDIGVTYAHKLIKEEGFLDFNAPALTLFQKIRGLVPQISVWISIATIRIKILQVKLSDFEFNINAGEVIIVDKKLYIQCQDKALEIVRLQPEGSKPMSSEDFIRGYQSKF